jgi:hypothetical protein
MSAFSFRKDFDKVQWGKTLWLNLLRAFCAGIVWGLVMLIASFSNPPSGDAPPWYALPFIFPLGFLFTLPMFLIAAKIFLAAMGDSGEFAVNLVTILLGLGLAAGDPFVFALHRIKPTLVPTEKFNFLNFALVLYVLDPAKAEP